jgi:transcriptional regulator with XRE-family HTH domain
VEVIIVNSIREHREAMVPKITQIQFAEAIGVSVDSIRRYEANTREPRVTELKRMAEFFGCSMDELVNPTPPPAKPAAQQGKIETA